MTMRKVLLGTGLMLLLGGCMGPQAGHLYNMRTGQTSTLQLDAPGYSNGNVKGTLPDGAACEGQVSQVSTENARRVSTVAPMLTENSRASVAVMNCGPNRVLRCTLARRDSGQFSYGECQDQQGTPFSLIF
jgi:hypothetical protein